MSSPGMMEKKALEYEALGFLMFRQAVQQGREPNTEVKRVALASRYKYSFDTQLHSNCPLRLIKARTTGTSAQLIFAGLSPIRFALSYCKSQESPS